MDILKQVISTMNAESERYNNLKSLIQAGYTDDFILANNWGVSRTELKAMRVHLNQPPSVPFDEFHVES